MSRILVIEDDRKTGNAICEGLAGEGFNTHGAFTGEEGLQLLSEHGFDLLVLDWMLPGRDGVEILKSVREGGSRVPVLLLTARDTVEDRVLGLNSGADDYLAKPFAFAELVARVRALLRRRGEPEPTRKQVSNLTLDVENRRVVRCGAEIAVTPREFDLLAYLVRHQGQTVTRQMLARDVWREPQRATPLDNVIDVHVAHLRRKIDDAQSTKTDESIRDGFAEVKFKPISGKEDQAGGLVFRFKDAGNYYVVRANALEGNVVLYKTVAGKRSSLPVKGRMFGYGVDSKEIGRAHV